MRKKYHCCIPGCKTYDTINNFLPLPNNTNWRNTWLSAIPRKNWIVQNSTVICSKHFQSPDFKITNSTSNDSNANNVEKIVLVQGSVPVINSKPKATTSEKNHCFPSEMCLLYPRDYSVPTTVKDENNQTDLIKDYDNFKFYFSKKVGAVLKRSWNVISAADHLIFYTLDFFEVPTIPSCIQIDRHLHATVYLCGRMMDPADLTWALPITGILNRWSQFEELLVIFAHDVYAN